MKTFLEARGLTRTTWHAPRDLDDVDQDVRAGRLAHVVFVRPDDLLDGIFHGEVDFDRWRATGTRVEFALAPDSTTDQTIEPAWRSWQQWRRRHRRRQIIGGTILSAVAIAAAFILVWLSGRG